MKFVPQFYILIYLSLNPIEIFGLTQPCNLRQTKYGSVCVCDKEYCDYLDEDDVNPNGPDEFILVSSSKDDLRFAVNKGHFNQKLTIGNCVNSNSKKLPNVILRTKRFALGGLIDSVNIPITNTEKFEIKINRNIEYQTIFGFGGSLTGAVSINLDKLSTELQDHIFRSYFSKEYGLGYNFIRTPIGGGCDFDTSAWAYNEQPIDDKKLSNFNTLDPRDAKKFDYFEKLKEVSRNNDIQLVGAAWSPPPWMKTNNQWSGYSNLKPIYYQTWADYHVKYLELVNKRNISFWAISTGNEPLNGIIGFLFVKFMSLGWYPGDQGVWLGQNLGPTLRSSKFKNVKILGADDQRYVFPYWFKWMESKQKNSTTYLDGLAVHWYWDNWISPNRLSESHQLYKNKLILNTESCVGDKPGETHGPELGSWERAEKYAKYYMEDLKHWVNVWIDWNIVLDEQGGPNYVQNYVDSPIIANTTSGAEIYKQPMFYAIGHYAKFIKKGSIIIDSQGCDEVDHLALKRPDNSIVIVLLNRKSKCIDFKITDNEKVIEMNIPPKSFHTIIYK